MNRPAEAIGWYRKALSIDPEEPLWLIDLSKALGKTGDIAGQRDALQRAAALGGQDPAVRAAVAESRSARDRAGR